MDNHQQAMLQEQVRKGLEAETLLNNRLLNEEIYALKQQYFSIWCDEAQDTKQREEIWQMQRTLNLIQNHFQQLATAGMEAQQLLNSVD